MTAEGENLLRTYASLMATPHDEALLEWHATGQLGGDRRRESKHAGDRATHHDPELRFFSGRPVRAGHTGSAALQLHRAGEQLRHC